MFGKIEQPKAEAPKKEKPKKKEEPELPPWSPDMNETEKKLFELMKAAKVTEDQVIVTFHEKGKFDGIMTIHELNDWEFIERSVIGNWDNFLKYAKQMTDASKGQWGYSTEYPYLYYGSNKTSTLEVKDGKFVLNMDDPAFVASLELLQDGALNKWSGWEGSSMASFQTGKSAMLGSFTQYEPDINSLAVIFGWDPIDYGAVPLPAGPNNPDGYNMVHASGFAIGQGSDCPAHTGKLIDMLVTGYAQMRVEERKDLPQAHKDLYAEMSKKQFCVNTRDSAVGGGYELAQAVSGGQSIAQAIEELKPQYQRKIDEVNGG